MGAVRIRAVHGHLGIRAGDALVREGRAHLRRRFPRCSTPASCTTSPCSRHVPCCTRTKCAALPRYASAHSSTSGSASRRGRRDIAGAGRWSGSREARSSGEIQLLLILYARARSRASIDTARLRIPVTQTAYPMAPAFTGASGSSITFTHATVPLASARSSAGRICAGSVTCSPWPPIASTTLS